VRAVYEPTRLQRGDSIIADHRESRIADVYTFRNGKAIEFRTFGDERQAMDWAGVEASGQTVHTT
jgi:hypothetical protein